MSNVPGGRRRVSPSSVVGILAAIAALVAAAGLYCVIAYLP